MIADWELACLGLIAVCGLGTFGAIALGSTSTAVAMVAISALLAAIIMLGGDS
jgi:hypothetical protein